MDVSLRLASLYLSHHLMITETTQPQQHRSWLFFFLTQCFFLDAGLWCFSSLLAHISYTVSCNTVWATTQQVQRNTRCGRGEQILTGIKPQYLFYIPMINPCGLYINTQSTEGKQKLIYYSSSLNKTLNKTTENKRHFWVTGNLQCGALMH